MLSTQTTVEFHVLETDLGFMAIVGRQGRLAQLTIGHASPVEALQAIEPAHRSLGEEAAWCARLVKLLLRYSSGLRVDFDDVPLDDEHLGRGTFREAVVTACRRIGYGQTSSYAELAEAAGSPRAARAVGNVMRTNRWPLVVPCHRVLASGQGLGGFSARGGLALKRRLLTLEGYEPGAKRAAAGVPR